MRVSNVFSHTRKACLQTQTRVSTCVCVEGAQDPARKVGDERVHMERNGGWVGHPVTGGQARWVDGAEANTAPTTIRPLHSQ